MTSRRDFLKTTAVTAATGGVLDTLAASANGAQTQTKTGAAPRPPAGRVIFSENWSSGAIDTNKWTVTSSPEGEWAVVDLGDGDYAIRGHGDGRWSKPDTSLMSKALFTRGKNLRVTFKVWGDPTKLSSGRKFPEGSTLVAPWHVSFYDYCGGSTLEAGLNAAAGQHSGDFRFSENRIQYHFAPPLADQAAFARAWSRAVSKSKALTLRVTLGDVAGAMFEWNDGTGWRKSVDTRDHKPPLAGNIGSAATVKLGFNPFRTSILVDDIVVEQDITEADQALAPHLSRRQPVVKSERTPWTNLNFNNRPENFRFAIVSDFTGQIRPELVELMVEKLNLLQPEFVMSVGDLIEGCLCDKDFIRQEFEELDSWLAPLQMPFFYVPGNHDIANRQMREAYRGRYGKDYYHFVYQDVLFLCLNVNEIGWGRLSSEQMDWADKVLADNRGVRWTMVFIHDPMWEYDWPDYGSKADWDRIEASLKDRPYTVFAGHYHFYAKAKRQGRNYYVLSRTAVIPGELYPKVKVTGGKSSVPADFNQIAWATMTDKGPILVNLPLLSVLDDEAYDKEQSQRELERWHPFMRKHAQGSEARYR